MYWWIIEKDFYVKLFLCVYTDIYIYTHMHTFKELGDLFKNCCENNNISCVVFLLLKVIIQSYLLFFCI